MYLPQPASEGEVRQAMRPDSKAFILETFWDQQVHEAARYCVIGASTASPRQART